MRAPRALARLAITVSIAGAGVTGGACLPGQEPVRADLADVVLEGAATPAALAEIADATPVKSAALAPKITHPPNLSVLPGDEIVTFEWTHGATAALPPRLDGAAALNVYPDLQHSSRPLLPAWLTDLLGPERAAFAAAEPLTDRGYYLVFTTITGVRLLRVFTTETSYTPDQRAWDALRSAGMWSGLTVVSAAFFGDTLLSGTGPFEGEHIEFCIERE